MTTLVLDRTTPGIMRLGIVEGGKVLAVEDALMVDDRQEATVALLDRFLVEHRCPFSSLGRFVVVHGPGRFSNLRVAAVLANTASWATGVPLATVRGTTRSFASPHARLLDAVRRSRPVRSVKPLYGMPPSITVPKRHR